VTNGTPGELEMLPKSVTAGAGQFFPFLASAIGPALDSGKGLRRFCQSGFHWIHLDVARNSVLAQYNTETPIGL